MQRPLNILILKKKLFLMLEYLLVQNYTRNNIPLLLKPLLVTTIKMWTYKERDFSFRKLQNMLISQCNSLKRKTFKISACSPLIKVSAFGDSSCLFFTLNRAKACYVIIVSVHNPPNYNFLANLKNFPAEIPVKEKQHINILIKFSQWPWKCIFEKY